MRALLRSPQFSKEEGTLMRKLFYCAAIAVAGLSASLAAQAGIIVATAQLDYAQEVSPSNTTASDATGTATITFDTETALLTLELSIAGISLADVTFADGGLAFGAAGPTHFHNAPAGTNGGIVLPFPDMSFFSDDGMGGLSVSAMDIPFAIDLLDELTAGNLYLNVHTLDYGSGEIRGQLASVAEPGSLALFGGMLAWIGMRSRKFRLPLQFN
jgi:hypothetical protein